MDNISISLATIPGRTEALNKTVASLLHQGDKINVFFNGFNKPVIDDGLASYPVGFEFQTRKINIGDQGKFNWHYEAGYHIICDDDIIYPADYVETMIEAIEGYKRKAVVSLHGRTFKKPPITNYYSHCSAKPHCRFDLDEDVQVHCPGTGVLAFHSDTINISLKDFQSKNMADLWFGIAAQKQNVPCLAIAHKGDWIKVQEVGNTIHSTGHRNPKLITKFTNSIKWKLPKM